MDRISRDHRSWNMSRIKGKDTLPEMIVRSCLHRMGFRFQLHRSDLPGNPDIVLPRYRTVIFVHGCFWHRHANCPYAYTPKSNVEFWLKKFEDNVKRDRHANNSLRKMGWRVVTVWECQTKDLERLEKRLGNILSS